MSKKKETKKADDVVSVAVTRTFNFVVHHKPRVGEYNNLPSCTQPDMVQPIGEILKRYAAGQVDSVMHDSHFSGDMPDISKLDKFELFEAFGDVKSQVDSMKSEIEDAVNEKKASDDAKKLDEIKKKAVEDYLAGLDQDKTD